MAAKQALSILTWLVWPENLHPTTGEPLPVPTFAREYLHKALHRMTYGDPTCEDGRPARRPVTGDQAFHLVRKGKQHWTLDDRKLACALVERARTMPANDSLEKAIDAALVTIDQIVESIQEHERDRHPWRNFIGRSLDARDLRRWHKALHIGI